MSKNAERLIILCDLSHGLLSRVHFLNNFKRDPNIFTPEIDKYSRTLIKKLPELPADSKGDKGFELFKKNATQLSAATNDFYLTFLDVLNFNDAAFALLQDMAASSQDFKFDANIDLLSFYMTLFQRFAQLQLLITLMDTPQLNLAIYAKAYQCTSGNTEYNYQRIAKFILKYGEGKIKECVKRLQEECQPLSLYVGNTIMAFSGIVHKWSTTKLIVDSKCFSIMDDPKAMVYPVNEKAFTEMMNLDKLKYWTLLGFLLCPAELGRPGSTEVLMKCIKDTFVLTIYRDKFINIQELMEDLFENYKKDKFKISKEKKKALKDAQSDWQFTLSSHAELRAYLRLEMANCINLFTEFPGCVPPKVQMIFAMLHLARDELVWYLRHVTLQPFHNSKKYQWEVDPLFSVLLRQCDELSSCVRDAAPAIKQYYLEYLSGLDYEKGREAATKFNKDVPQSGLVHDLIESIVSSIQSRSADDNFEGIRLNWYRISAALNHSQSGVPTAAANALSVAMNQIVLHTRNVDCIETQLKTHGSYQLLFWFKSELLDQLKLCLNGNQGQQVNCMWFIRCLNHALHNVHRVAPEEQSAIGKESVTVADEYMRLVTGTTERLLQSIIGGMEQLRNETSASATIGRLADPTPRALPGAESMYENRKVRDVVNLRVCRKALADICESIHNTDSVVVYNLQFIPREYMKESLTISLRSYLRHMSVQNGNFQRPTHILMRFKDIIASYQQIERSMNFCINDVVREVFFTEFQGKDEATEMAAASAAATGNGEQEKTADTAVPLIHIIATFYYNLFSKDIAEAGIIYSPLRKCFMHRRNFTPSHVQQQAIASLGLNVQEIERFTDVTDLRALCQLCGPAGFRIIDKALLKIVATHVKNIKEIVQNNHSTLQQLAGRYTEPDVWNEHIANVQQIDLLVIQTTIVGAVLHFRELLRQALWDTAYHRSTQIQKGMALAHLQIHSRVVDDAAFLQFDNYAYDCGIELNEADHQLRAALSKFKTGVQDLQLFQMLPEIYGLAYVASRWKSAQFSIEYEGFYSNLHCSAIAVRHLIVTFNRVALKESAHAASIDVEKRIQNDFERFVRCSAYSLLHMNAANAAARAQSSSAELPYNINGAMLFLEQFVMNSGGRLKMAMLESCFPFTLLRTNFIQLYEKQTDSYAAPVADEEKE